MPTEELEIVEALVIHPGDKLLVRVPRDSDPEQAREVQAKLKERFPEVEVTIIAADELAVVRSEDT